MGRIPSSEDHPETIELTQRISLTACGSTPASGSPRFTYKHIESECITFALGQVFKLSAFFRSLTIQRAFFPHAKTLRTQILTRTSGSLVIGPSSSSSALVHQFFSWVAVWVPVWLPTPSVRGSTPRRPALDNPHHLSTQRQAAWRETHILFGEGSTPSAATFSLKNISESSYTYFKGT